MHSEKSYPKDKKHRVFVYGTLKRGFGNWKWCLDNEDSNFIGEYVIPAAQGYRMVSLGAFPGVLQSEESHDIHGEIFEVTDNVLRDLDMLEGYPNFYDKTVIDDEGTIMYVLEENEYGDHDKVPSGIWS